LPQNGLYYGDDWCSDSGGNDAAHGVPAFNTSLAGHVDVVNDPAVTAAADYKNRIAYGTSPGYESIYFLSHGGAGGNAFKTPPDLWGGGGIDSSELAALNPQAHSYVLMSCDTGDYSQPNTIASDDVFGTGMGLVSVANAGIDGWRDYTKYLNSLGLGQTYGQAWFTWGQTGDFTPTLTMFGDPLLRTEAYTPPASTGTAT
jgi:hypothetical protein